MEWNFARSWFIKCGIAAAIPLLIYLAVALAGPKAPPLPTSRTGALEQLDRYVQGPVPDIVLVGSSYTSGLKEAYFDTDNLRVLGLVGGSTFTSLKVLTFRERLPKIVLVEMNILDRGEDAGLVQRFTDGSNAFTPPHPIKAAVAFYERWRHAPPDRHQAAAIVAAQLRARPSEFDNRLYVDAKMQEWNGPIPTDEILKNIATLKEIVQKIQVRGALVYFYTLPYAEPLKFSNRAQYTSISGHAAFPNEEYWLHLELPVHELRWPDGTHLDARSSIIVAKEMQKQLSIRNDRRPR